MPASFDGTSTELKPNKNTENINNRKNKENTETEKHTETTYGRFIQW